MTPMIRLLISVFTVRRVATFLRAPWCNSIVMMFLDGWEKQTDKCDISLTSLPAVRETRCFNPTSRLPWHTSRTLHTNYPGLDLYLDYSIVSVVPSWFSKNVYGVVLGFKASAKPSRAPLPHGGNILEADSPLAGIVSVSSECMYLILSGI